MEHRRYRSFPVVFHPQSDKGPFTIFPSEESLHTVTFKTFSAAEPGQYIVVEDVDYSSHFSNDFQSRKTMTLLDVHKGTATEVKEPEPGEECPFFSATSMYEKYNWDTRNVEWKFQSKSGLGRCKIHIGDPGQVTGTLNIPAAFIPDNSPDKFEKPWIKSSRLNNHLLETDLLGDDGITVRYWNIEQFSHFLAIS